MDEKIAEILENFDFEKVHNVMTFLNWKWATSKHGVPKYYELIKSAEKMLNDAYKVAIDNDSDFIVSSGGFSAYAEWISDEYIELSLEFILEEY